MNSKTSHERIATMVQIALLAALIVVIQLFFSNIQIGPVTLSFVLAPITIGAIFISPIAGMLLGALSGVITFIQVFTSANVFYVFLIGHNTIMTFVVCVVKTAMAGLIAGIIYRIISKKSNHRIPGVIASAAICPIVNTLLFCLGMLVFFADGLKQSADFGAVATENIFNFIFIVLPGINFIFELILNIIICPALAKALFSTKYFK